MSITVQYVSSASVTDGTILHISPVDVERTFLITRASGNSSTANEGPDTWAFGTELISPSGIECSRRPATTALGNVGVYAVTCDAEEFFVRRGLSLIATGSSTGAINFSSPLDVDRTFLTATTWVNNTANNSVAFDGFVSVHLDSPSRATTVRATASGTYRNFIQWEAVTWASPTGVTVTHGYDNVSGNLAAGTTISTGVTVDTSRSFLIATFDHDSNGLEQCSLATTLNASDIFVERYDQTTSYSSNIAWQIIEFPSPTGLVVQHGDTVTAASGDFTVTDTVSSYDTNQSVVTGWNSCNGTGTAFTRPLWLYETLSPTAVQFRRIRSGQDSEIRYQVIDFSGFTYSPPGVGAFTLTADQQTYTLTGQDTAFARGLTLTADQQTYTLTGQDAALNRGLTLLADEGTFSLVGQDLAFARGLSVVADSGSFTLSGQDAALTAERALLAQQQSYALTGQDAALNRGVTLAADQATFVLAGQDAALTRDAVLVSNDASFTVSGQQADLAAARVIDAAQASYSLAGQDTDFILGLSLTAEQATFTLSGQDAGLAASFELVAEQQSYTLTGQDTAFDLALRIVAEQAAFAVEGQAAVLTRAALLTADQASYTFTGQDAGLLFDDLFIAEVGVFALSGQDATLSVVRRLTADLGTYVVTGQDAALAVGVSLIAEVGSFALTGQDAGFLRALLFTAEQTTFALTGQDAALSRGLLLAADQSTYTVAGQPILFGFGLLAEQATFTLTGFEAAFLNDESLAAEVATFTLTGQGADLRRAAQLGASPASFAVSGQDALFLLGEVFVADTATFVVTGQPGLFRLTVVNDTGTFVVTGQDATVAKAVSLEAELGTYVVAGQDALFPVGEILVADEGLFTAAGQDAALSRQLRLTAETANYYVDGQVADLRYARALFLIAESSALLVAGQSAELAREAYLGAGTVVFNATGVDSLGNQFPDTPSFPQAVNFQLRPASGGIFYYFFIGDRAYSVTGQAAELTVVQSITGAPPTRMRLDNICVYQQDAQSQLIGWNLWTVGNENPNTAQVRIDRAYSENGTYEQIDLVPALNQFYLDSTVNVSDLWRRPFYRLQLVVNNSALPAYDPVRLDGDITGPAINAMRASQVLVRQGGSPVLVFQRRFAEDRCSCWDAVMQKSSDPDCPMCFGTGYTEGYYEPIATLAVIDPESKQNTPGDITRQDTVTRAMMANYPLLRPRDLIHETNQGGWYRVGGITPAEYKRVLVNQSFSLTRINPSDIETTLEVPDLSTLNPILIRAVPGKTTFANAPSAGSPNLGILSVDF